MTELAAVNAALNAKGKSVGTDTSKKKARQIQQEPRDLSISIQGEGRDQRKILRQVYTEMSAHGYGRSSCGVVELVLAEAINNVIKHAYGGRQHGLMRISVNAQGPDLKAEIHDWGRKLPGGIMPRGLPPRMDLPVHKLPEGGFGWFLIRKLAHSIRYKRVGSENILTIMIRPERDGPMQTQNTRAKTTRA